MLDRVINGYDVEHVDDVADAVLIEEGDFPRGKRDEVTLWHDESATICQPDGKRFESVGQPFLDVIKRGKEAGGHTQTVGVSFGLHASAEDVNAGSPTHLISLSSIFLSKNPRSSASRGRLHPRIPIIPS